MTAEPDVPERLSRILGHRYDLVREVGSGGMARVFLARDRKHSRDVAIKVLRWNLIGSIAADRFLQEVQIASGLQHPNILPLLDSGSEDGVLFYVMPYVEGETLFSHLQTQQQLGVEEVVGIVEGIARALDYAHARGVVHRDIKPGNIFLAGDQPLVGDFGVARAFSQAGGDRLTESGLAVGTPTYMSPEQASGQSTIDARADVYSLGCLAFEMLAGEPPFTGPTGQSIIAKHASQGAPPLRVVRPSIPGGMAKAVRKSLAKVPADRFPSAGDFARALSEGRTLPDVTQNSWLGVPGWIAAVAIPIALVLLWMAFSPQEPLDPNRVVVFPLVTTESPTVGADAGERLAILVGEALDRTDPLEWDYGWYWLSPEQRNDQRSVLPGDMARIARERGAAFYVDGWVVSEGDSATVVMHLRDVQGDSVTARASGTGPVSDEGIVKAGLDAVKPLLPALIDAGGVNLDELEGYDLSAVAQWLHGEREYRRSRYEPARSHFLTAMELDPTLAAAALGAAMAGIWDERQEEADLLLNIALAEGTSLPTHRRLLAQGLKEDFAGQADSAVGFFRQAISTDSSWAEAWMGLGEVYFHLLPRAEALDSLAEHAFRSALHADPEFLPPVFHLAEMAILRRDLQGAEAHMEQWRLREGNEGLASKLELMFECAAQGPEEVDWSGLIGVELATLVRAGKTLAVGGAEVACAQKAFQTVLDHPEASAQNLWGALLGMTATLVAQGDSAALVSLLSSPGAARVGGSQRLHLIADAAIPGISSHAPEVAEWLQGQIERRASSIDLWILGAWSFRHGNLEGLQSAAEAAIALADSTNSSRDETLARTLAGQLLLARGDSIGASESLSTLLDLPHSRPDLAWGLFEPLALERLLLAELALARGDATSALVLTRMFTSSQPIMFVMYMREALHLLMQAAESLGDMDLQDEISLRLASLALSR